MKIHFYKLHYFSLILNFIIFIIFLVLDLIDIFVYETFNWKLYFFYLAYLIFQSFEYAFGKKLFLYGFLSPYGLLIRKGLYQTVIVVIFSFINILIDVNIYIHFGVIFKDKEYIFLLISLLITSFFANLSLWFIIDRFSLCHLPLAIILEELCDFISDLILSNEINTDSWSWEIIVRLILYLILFIGVMIHNEIIIINICGLGSFTKYFLDIEVINEDIYSIADNPEIMQKYETQAELDIMPDDNNRKLN